jgi:hypothetical protein
MKVLIAGEESQTICIEFRKRGHEAYSCDLKPCSGGYPEWHYQEDLRNYLKEYFDLVIFHPDCTYHTNSGVRWLYNKDGSRNKDRWAKLWEAIIFFNLRHKFNAKRVATENPIPHKYSREGFLIDSQGKGLDTQIEGIGKYDQLIQPYQYGHGETKATCLWLKNLPLLKPTNIVEGREQRIWKLPPSENRAELRSKTYQGIAEAMAEQWGVL